MRIKTLTLAGVVLCALTGSEAIAKKTPFTSAALPRHATKEQCITYGKQIAAQMRNAQSSAISTTAKTTALSSRIVGYAYREFDGSSLFLLDTAHLKYSYGRGGDMNSDFIKFDNALGLSYNDTISKLQESNQQTQVFDAAHNIVSNTYQVWNTTLSAFVNDSRSFFTYTADKKTASDSAQLWTGTAWENSGLRHVSYDVARNMLADSNYEWDGSDWQPNVVYKYTYTPANKVATMSVVYFISAVSTWMEIMKTTYTYDGSGNLTQELTQTAGTSLVLENDSRSTYTYDAVKNQVGQLNEYWDNTASTWVNGEKYSNIFDASANKTESIEQEWDDADALFDTVMRTLYTYNAYKQMTSETTQTWDAGTSSWTVEPGDSKTNYYYTDFDPASVKEISKQGSLRIFPVPVQNELYLEINGTEQQNMSISLLDLQGRVLQSQQAKSAVNYNSVIPVAHLPAGNYIVLVKGDKGLNVMQKLTVAH